MECQEAERLRQPIDVRIHDSSIGIWQDNAQDATFRSEIYAVLIRRMRACGWSIRRDPVTHRHYRCLSPDRRAGARGTLRCTIGLTGRVVDVEFWSVTAPQSNRNGRQYDFDKMKRMRHLDRLRVELEFRRIGAWLETVASVKISRSDDQALPPMKRIEKSYAESWHKDKDLGRPVCRYDYNGTSKDGARLEHGQTVWFPDHKGRIIRGTAFYNINNMWWVVAGGKLFNESCHTLFATQPDRLRIKRNEGARRSRMERELSIAVERMDFQRAQVLKHIIFGGEQTFMIWSRGNGAYYRSQYAGYTTDRIAAGKYTRAEAEAECRRVPHELEMVCPDGSHVRFDRSAA
ncbi:hypothetical protein [Rhizobium leguminosarum]|uniref:hypothetical protein n=1 Tax=Rhizobium leguminosarum TaxID=384 RepID=UPI0003825FF3|nr:hypothetical protein [Rhizobium leguminosarum]